MSDRRQHLLTYSFNLSELSHSSGQIESSTVLLFGGRLLVFQGALRLFSQSSYNQDFPGMQTHETMLQTCCLFICSHVEKK